jgi:hypothetical protein
MLSDLFAASNSLWLPHEIIETHDPYFCNKQLLLGAPLGYNKNSGSNLIGRSLEMLLELLATSNLIGSSHAISKQVTDYPCSTRGCL